MEESFRVILQPSWTWSMVATRGICVLSVKGRLCNDQCNIQWVFEKEGEGIEALESTALGTALILQLHILHLSLYSLLCLSYCLVSLGILLILLWLFKVFFFFFHFSFIIFFHKENNLIKLNFNSFKNNDHKIVISSVATMWSFAAFSPLLLFLSVLALLQWCFSRSLFILHHGERFSMNSSFHKVCARLEG